MQKKTHILPFHFLIWNYYEGMFFYNLVIFYQGNLIYIFKILIFIQNIQLWVELAQA